MAIAEIKWKLVKDTYFFDTTTCYLSENGNHLFYSGNEKRIKILIDDLNELVRKGCAMWLKLGEYEFALDKLSKCPTTTWYSINRMLYSLEPWGVIKESKKSARKSLKEAKNGYYIYTKLDNKYAYCDKSKFTEEGFYLIEDYMLDAIHIFETEKEAEKFIDEDLNRFMVKKDNVVIDEYPSTKRGFFESRKSIKETHGFDEENEYMLELSVVTNESLIKDTLEEDGLEVDWDYISKVSSELDYAIERKFAKEIGHVAIEEFHDDDSYNCTFWVRFDDAKANKYMKNLNYFDDYTRGNSTVFMYDVDEILDNEIDKLEKKYDSDILGILRECVAVEIEVPTESVFNESRKSIKEAKDTEIKVYFDGHTTPSNKYQDYNFSPYSKKYEIIGLTESKDDVILTFERGNAKSLTYLGVTVDFDKENNAKCDKWECEIDIDEVQEYIIKFKLTLFK